MAYWQKTHVQAPKGPMIKVTNGYGRSFLCENDDDAEWLLKLLKKHADKPDSWTR